MMSHVFCKKDLGVPLKKVAVAVPTQPLESLDLAGHSMRAAWPHGSA
jgi:hypothetical protein